MTKRARLTELEWQVILGCLIFQDCNDGDGRPWGESNNIELTERERDKHNDALTSAIEKINARSRR